METASFYNSLNYNENKIATSVVIETSFSKEIRILLKKEQVMKEHKAPFPIIVHVLEGDIDFGVENEVYKLTQGDIITLDSNIPHDLKACEDSIVRLTLSKFDNVSRVEDVVANS